MSARAALPCALALALGLGAAPALAQLPDEPPAAPAEPAELPAKPLEAPAEDASEEQKQAYWEARAKQARERVAAARERVAASEAAYQDMRQRHHEAGPAKEKLTSERDAASAELESAIRYLEEELPEEARRAGALPGWVRGE
jgi:hypothetical protein